MNPPFVMSSNRFVSRASKTRFFAYICFILVLFAVVYVFHGTQTQLQEAIRESDYCSQKAESLSVKLQRANFHATQLQRTLDTEKDIHQQTVNELNASFSKEKNELNVKITDAESRYNNINEKYLALQKEYHVIVEESNAARKENMDQKDDNAKLTSKFSAAQSECNRLIADKDKEILGLKEKLNVCNHNMKKSDQNEAAVDLHDKAENLFAGSGPVTPGVNPQAVDSAADHDDIMKQNLTSSTTAASSSNKENYPMGVLPLPQPINGENKESKTMNEALNVKGRVKSFEEEMAPNNEQVEKDNADPKNPSDLNNQAQIENTVEENHPNIAPPPDASGKDDKSVLEAKRGVESDKQIQNDSENDDDREAIEDEAEENDEDPDFLDGKESRKQIKPPVLDLNNNAQ